MRIYTKGTAGSKVRMERIETPHKTVASILDSAEDHIKKTHEEITCVVATSWTMMESVKSSDASVDVLPLAQNLHMWTISKMQSNVLAVQQPLDHFRDNFSQQRKRMAYRTKNPRLLRITFHTLRHFKGTMEYQRTKDILHVMQVLGHKNIKNTLLYVQLAEALFKDQQEFVSKVAKTEKDACELVEAGFDYVCGFNGTKIFRKNKY